jgi:hypothetical protein
MVKLAVLHESLSEQAKDQRLPNIEVVFADINSTHFQEQVHLIKPHVIVLDLDLLGADPIQYIREIKRSSEAKVIIVAYSFAKWNLIQQLTTEGVRIVKSPINMRLLQSSMLGIVVKEIMQSNKRLEDTEFNAPPNRYSTYQLSQLQQIQSAIECECPNHLADLVIALSAFERYSRDCNNRNEEDAAIHAMLYQRTAEARQIMENALTRLCEHENIVLTEQSTV